MPKDFKFNGKPADFILLVEGQRFEVHSNILAKCSRYFRRTFWSRKPDEMWSVDGKPMMIFDDSVGVKDMEMMLDFFYEVRHTFEGVEEAARMLYMAERLDVPELLEASARYLWNMTDKMHFFEVEALKNAAEDAMDSHSLTRWLSVADSLNIPTLRLQCQYGILWDMLKNPAYLQDGDKVSRVFMALERNAVSPKRVCEICFAILHAVYNLSELDKGQHCSAEPQPNVDGNRANSTEGKQPVPKDLNMSNEGTKNRCYSPIIDTGAFFCCAASYLGNIED